MVNNPLPRRCPAVGKSVDRTVHFTGIRDGRRASQAKAMASCSARRPTVRDSVHALCCPPHTHHTCTSLTLCSVLTPSVPLPSTQRFLTLLLPHSWSMCAIAPCPSYLRPRPVSPRAPLRYRWAPRLVLHLAVSSQMRSRASSDMS